MFQLLDGRLKDGHFILRNQLNFLLTICACVKREREKIDERKIFGDDKIRGLETKLCSHCVYFRSRFVFTANVWDTL